MAGTLGFTTGGINNFWIGTAADTASSVRVLATEDGEITDVNAYLQCSSGSERIKAVIWSNGRTVLGVGNTVLVTTSRKWYQATFTTPVRITSGLYYYIGFVRDSLGGGFNLRWSGFLEDNYFSWDATNSYASPQSIPAASTKYGIRIYVNYQDPTGPSLLIEGITPSKIEGVDWVDIADIK